MDFWYRGQRVRRSTGQIDREAAAAVERRAQDAMRQAAHGVAIVTATPTPTFDDWTEFYFKEVSPRLKRPQAKRHLLNSILRFWGRRPELPTRPHPQGVYHALTLGDVMNDPHWIVRWETWLSECGLSAQTKNHYRSTMLDLFKVALSPAWRERSGVTSNPFAGQWRDPTEGRDVALTPADVRVVLEHASYHLRLAMSIALLAPKLRLANILALEWARHISEDFGTITVADHKTRRQTKRPLVVFVPVQLQGILKAARARRPQDAFVVTYQGKPVKKKVSGAIKGAVERAAAAGATHLKYGRADRDGITFHTLRHTAATLLAELEVAPEKRQALMGHGDLATTMRYTHLRPMHEREPGEQLSALLSGVDTIVMDARSRGGVGKVVSEG